MNWVILRPFALADEYLALLKVDVFNTNDTSSLTRTAV
jgi:hypothetical protein